MAFSLVKTCMSNSIMSSCTSNGFPSGNTNGKVVSVNISSEKGVCKSPVSSAEIDRKGIVGDAHALTWHRQVSLLSKEKIDWFSQQQGRAFRPGEFAENLTTLGIDLSRLNLRDRLRLSGGAELEVTQIGKECHGGGCAIFREVGRCVMPNEGIFTRVITGGTVNSGDQIIHEPRPLRISVITLSDRASNGEYADESGPLLAERLKTFLAKNRWGTELTTKIIPDDPARLRQALIGDLIFTTGGTGIGPRDITVDTIKPLLTKEIPGIMEQIRARYASIPSACLSRGIAGIMGEALVFTLPGSPKAVSEYLDEIFKSLPHALQMFYGFNAH